MAPTYTYSLQGTVPNQYLRLDAVGGTFDVNTDLVLDTGMFDGVEYPVKEIIDDGVFFNNESAHGNLRSITMNNLTTLSGTNTFYGCYGLTDVTFPNLTTLTGRGTFRFCTGLTSVYFPNLTIFTGTFTFYTCTSLTDLTLVNLGSTITTYPDYTFQNCRFVDIILPSQITSLGNSVFSENTTLLSFSGPNLTSIGFSTFFYCISLTNFELVNLGVTITSYPANTFQNCRFVDITLPNQITSLGNSVFAENTALLSFSGPNLTSIGTGTFNGCTGLVTCILGTISSFPPSLFLVCGQLRNLYIRSTTQPTLGDNAFTNTLALEYIFIPWGANWPSFTEKTLYPVSLPSVLVSSMQSPGNTLLSATTTSNLPGGYTIPYYTYQWYKNGLIINGATSATYTAITDDTYYVSVTDPLLQTTQSDPVVVGQAFTYSLQGDAPNQYLRLISVGDTIFAPDTDLVLNTAIWPADGLSYPVKEISAIFFSNVSARTNLRSITMNNLTTLSGSNTFFNCTGLTSVTFPNVTTLSGISIFSGCTSLTNFGLVNLGATITTYPASTFYGCRFVDIILPSQITSLGNSVFAGNTALQSFSGPNLTSIGTGTFNGCTSLTNFGLVDLGSTITTYPASTFQNCRFVTIILPSQITSLGNSVFFGNTALESFSGENLIGIGIGTFEGCTALTNFTEVNLGATITSYPDFTFYGCGFETITLLNLITSLGSNVFAENTALLSFSGPNLTSIGTGTFNGCTSLTVFELVNLGSIITTYPDYTFYNCRFVTITLPSQITSLGNSVFARNTALVSVSGPNLTSIGTDTFNDCISLVTCILGTISSFPSYLFYLCEQLRNLYIRSTAQPTLGDNAFTNTLALQYIFIRSDASWPSFTEKTLYPVSVPSVLVSSMQSPGNTLLSATVASPFLPVSYTIPYYTYQWYKNGSIINGATSATYIAITDDTYYVRVTDPLLQTTQSDPVVVGQAISYTVLANGTASITECGLSGTIKLMYISGSTSNGQLSNIPSSSSYPITEIGANAFLGQTGITGVAAPFVTTVGASAFSGCTALAYLYIGIASGVPTFGTGCFTGCDALTNNVFKNIINTEWQRTADPSPSGTGLNTYTPLAVTGSVSVSSAAAFSLTPVVQSGGTASKSPPTLTTLYNYYVNGTQTQTDITVPVAQEISPESDTYYLTAGNAFETNAAVSANSAGGASGSQGVSQVAYGSRVLLVSIG